MKMDMRRVMPALVLPLGLLLGCWGGGGKGSGPDPSKPLAAGTYTLVFSMMPGPDAIPVNGVDLPVGLPAGVTVPTASSSQGRILDSALGITGDVPGTCLIRGRFSSAEARAQVTLATTTTAVWQGDFVKMSVAVSAAVPVTETELLAAVRKTLPTCTFAGLSAQAKDAVTPAQASVQVRLVR